MMKSSVVGRNTLENRNGRYSFLPAVLPLIVLMVALLLGGLLGALDASLSASIVAAIIMVLVVIVRQDELAVTMIVAGHLYIDWYLGLHLVALLMALMLLFTFFFMRSASFPWVEPSALWLWAVFLVLPIVPAIRGASTLYDAATFYPGNILGAFMMYWLGLLIARNIASMRRFFKLFAALGALLALHTINQATTGVVLFESARVSAALANVSNYQLLGSDAHRASSFFINPDWNGAFFAMIFFLPLGLFIESSSWLEKGLYLVEMALIVPALLFTYSNGAWISMAAAVIVFIAFVGRTRYHILFPFFIMAIVIAMLIAFPTQITLQLQHANNPIEVSLRLGAWETGIRVIQAFPLTGVGLGYDTYLLSAEPYRVPTQIISLAHPHNSYLEWGAMAGLPVLAVFVALLAHTLWLAWRNWTRVDVRTRALLGAGMAAIIALSFNSLSVNAWTLPPMAAMGWLILGVITSPLLVITCRKAEEKKSL